VPDHDALVRAAAANHRAWFRRGAAVAGGAAERVGGLDLVVAGRDGTIAFPRPGQSRTRLRERLDGVMARADELGLRALSCWSVAEDRPLGTLLVARGFEWGWQPHWMVRDLADAPEPPQPPATDPAHDVVEVPASNRPTCPFRRICRIPRPPGISPSSTTAAVPSATSWSTRGAASPGSTTWASSPPGGARASGAR
jgi:hypothetical protein